MFATTHASPKGTYSVPQRFGISAILALTTLFAFVFATLRSFNAPPVFYLFFGTLAVTICLVQMIFGRVPRLSSILAGALLLPFWVFVTATFDQALARFLNAIGFSVITLPITIVVGGGMGYLTGTLMAGFFLLLDMAQTVGTTDSSTLASQDPRDRDQIRTQA